MWNKTLLSILIACLFSSLLTEPVFGEKMKGKGLITLFMCGDVMTGRGIDQVLPHPGDSRIHEPYVKDAREYLDLAETANGPIQKPVSYAYIWGEALEELKRISPDVRIINLETTITKSNDYWKNKRIHYRMHPKNIPCLTAAEIDYCSLANNHVLDWGYPGLIETLVSLEKAQVKHAGAGRNLREAESPALMEIKGEGRVIVFSYGLTSSGIPPEWAASQDRSGVNLLENLSDRTVRDVREKVRRVKRHGDVVIASIHWGNNWGYEIPHEQVQFAHKLIVDADVDVIHGHSSHHVKAFEIYKDKLILYGSGDFLNDYEGIEGYAYFRDDLTLMYFARVDPSTGELVELRMSPMQIKQLRLNRASRADALWLQATLNREGKRFGTHVEIGEDNTLILRRD